MFRITVKVQTATAAAHLTRALEGNNVATADLGGGWHSVSFLHTRGAISAREELGRRFPRIVYAKRITEVELPPGVNMAAYHIPAKPVPLDVLGALQKLHTALLMCESVGLSVVAGSDNANEPTIQIIDRMADAYLYDGTDHGGQEHLNPAAVELAMIQHNKVRSQ